MTMQKASKIESGNQYKEAQKGPKLSLNAEKKS